MQHMQNSIGDIIKLFNLLSNAHNPVALAEELFGNIEALKPIFKELRGKNPQEAWGYMNEKLKEKGTNLPQIVSNLNNMGVAGQQFINLISSKISQLGLKF